MMARDGTPKSSTPSPFQQTQPSSKRAISCNEIQTKISPKPDNKRIAFSSRSIVHSTPSIQLSQFTSQFPQTVQQRKIQSTTSQLLTHFIQAQSPPQQFTSNVENHRQDFDTQRNKNDQNETIHYKSSSRIANLSPIQSQITVAQPQSSQSLFPKLTQTQPTSTSDQPSPHKHPHIIQIQKKLISRPIRISTLPQAASLEAITGSHQSLPASSTFNFKNIYKKPIKTYVIADNQKGQDETVQPEPVGGNLIMNAFDETLISQAGYFAKFQTGRQKQRQMVAYSVLSKSDNSPALPASSSNANRKATNISTFISPVRKSSIPSFKPQVQRRGTLASQSNDQINNTITYEPLDSRLLPKIESPTISNKPVGSILAYSAITHSGLVRPYNEDRVSIVHCMAKPSDKNYDGTWPEVSFFSIFDGHGGAMCADFLRDHLHFFIVKDDNFPSKPKIAIHQGFIKAEQAFLKIAQQLIPLERSGSCAVVLMVLEDELFIANVGDSRAVLSKNGGESIFDLSVDHKPNLPVEEKRIVINGGTIYQSSIISQFPPFQLIKGPHRVLPGRLSVSRTFGDAEAKLKKYGGNPKVISCEPDIVSFRLSDDSKENKDFIILGCDGIFDRLTSQESVKFAWEGILSSKERNKLPTNHTLVGDGAENLLKQALLYKSFDNLTVVLVLLRPLEEIIAK